MSTYADKVKLSHEDPEAFWGGIAEGLHWYKKWDKVMDDSERPFTKWFTGGELNVCYNCVDRHVEAGHGDKTAFIYKCPVNNTSKRLTFNDVQDTVSRLAGLLVSLGVVKGDVVAIYMPSILEGAMSFLACARIGAVHNAIPGGLPASDTARRIQNSEAKVVILASHGYQSVGWMNYKDEIDQALTLGSHHVKKCIIYQREGLEKVKMNPSMDIDWTESLKTATPHPCVPVLATSPFFILFTSGSTGTPKAIVHSVAFAIRNLLDFDLLNPDKENGLFYGTTSLGWIAGHMILVYGPLINRCPGFLLEGDPLFVSDSRALYRTLSENQISHTMLRPGLLRALKQFDPDCKIAREFDLTRLKIVLVGGEYVDEVLLTWSNKALGVPIINLYAQTEIGAVLSMKYDFDQLDHKVPFFMSGKPAAGLKMRCLREDMTFADPGEHGRLVLELPLPLGGLNTVFRQKDLCKKTYFDTYPGYFDTKDEGYISETGEIKIERRADDTIKAGFIYVSAKAIEDVILQYPLVSEVSVAPRPDQVHRELPIAFVVRTKECDEPADVMAEAIIERVHSHFGKSLPFQHVIFIEALPRSFTGKTHKPTLTNLLRKIDMEFGGIENHEVVEEIRSALSEAQLI